MRQEMAFLVRDMWLNLGRNKSYFVSNEEISLVGAVLRMTLVPVHDIRVETLPIFFDMINFEVGTSRKGLTPFFYRTDPLLYHKFGNMVIFRPGTLYSLCNPGNQHYQKIIYFLIFSSKRVEIRDQSSIIKNI